MITWRRARGHRDGSVITAYEGAVEGVEYLIESRYALGSGKKEYRAFRIVRGRPDPSTCGSPQPSLPQAKDLAEQDLAQLLNSRH